MKIVFAANNGDIGGGEVMLLALARAARSLGHDVLIVGPKYPDDLVATASRQGFRTKSLNSTGRAAYMLSLRRWWGGKRDAILWCNGFLPALATAGMRNRIVHLHQIPNSKLKRFLPFARIRAIRMLVPSSHMQKAIPGSHVLPNWSDKIEKIDSATDSSQLNIGFIGRFSSDKGLPLLIEALEVVSARSDRQIQLLLAGEPRFVGEVDRQKVTKAIERSHVQIVQVGWVRPESFFSKVDFVVIPSVWPEPFGLVATEAASAEVPLVVSDAGALPQIVGPDHPWVAKAGDRDSLAAVIENAISTPPEDVASTVKRLYGRWDELYSPVAGRRALENLLNSVREV